MRNQDETRAYIASLGFRAPYGPIDTRPHVMIVVERFVEARRRLWDTWLAGRARPLFT